MEEIYKNLSLENLENEIWRDVVGYEGKYQVSSYGRVKSIRDNHNNIREKILSQCECSNGYLKVNLYKDKKRETFQVHRLVATAFIPNTNGYRCVNHKNEIKTDNRVENLEWCDDKYNLNYKNAQAKRVASTDWKSVAEKKSKQVFQYNKNGELVAIWQSTKEVGRNGFDQGNISKCCNGKLKHYKGYLWSYTEIN